MHRERLTCTLETSLAAWTAAVPNNDWRRQPQLPVSGQQLTRLRSIKHAESRPINPNRKDSKLEWRRT